LEIATSWGFEVSAHTQAAERLCFDAFEFDTRTVELRKRGLKLRLRGQPLQVLAVLLHRRGDLVTRDELRAEIWAEDTFVNFDHSLHNAIARLREALGDSAAKARYIETLPRRGYRFIGQIEKVDMHLADPRMAKQFVEGPISEGALRNLTMTVSVALLALASIAAGMRVNHLSAQTQVKEPQLPALAVLPLDNLSGDPSQDYFVDGMTDELITDLAKEKSLRVISRTSVMHFKGSRKTLPEIAGELNVDAVIEGSVERIGKRVRIRAQLLYAHPDRHLWAETFESDSSDILRLQSEVGQAIARQVQAQFLPPAHEQLHDHSTYARRSGDRPATKAREDQDAD
jgi:TolB-like protein/DNA-binding winged helix-turn-helix (wHTH) protein